jgi:uncharacterized membrane protein (DUF2068 family)
VILFSALRRGWTHDFPPPIGAKGVFAMSSVSAKVQRPPTLIAATVLLALISLLSLTAVLQNPPQFVVITQSALGIVGLVAVIGLWQRRVWGAWMAVIVMATNTLTNVAGIWQAPTPFNMMCAVVAVASLVVIVLVLLPSSRRAYQ